MRIPWQDDGSRRGRRPDRSGPAPNHGSPYDFGTPDPDPVDLMAIRADDELLDALASGRAGYGGGYDGRSETSNGELDTEFDGIDLGGDFRDDQQLLAMLHAWRSEVLDEPIPELVTVEQASEAIVSGHHARTGRPRRRLMPVAAAAVVVVLGLSGVAFGAGAAKPGDALWGVSKTLDGERAASVESVERVSVALASARAALADGRVTEAQAVLAAVGPELAKVTDEGTKQELARRSANLAETAEAAEEGEQVRTDESGNRDRDAERREDSGAPGQQPSEPPGSPQLGSPQSGNPRSGNPQSGDSGSGGTGEGDTPGEGAQSGPDQGPPLDTRRAPSSAEESAEPAPGQPAPKPAPPPPPPPEESAKPSPKPDKPASSPGPSPDKPKGQGEGERKGEADPEGEGEPKSEGGTIKRPTAGPVLTTPARAPQTPQPSF